MSNESKFEVGKWYYFKDNTAQAEFRLRVNNNISIADDIVESGGFCPVKIVAGNVTNVELAYGSNMDMILYPIERKFFTEMVKVEECDEEKCEDAAPSDPTDFPLTKFTISNNSEAWTVYQMLKAHFKE